MLKRLKSIPTLDSRSNIFRTILQCCILVYDYFACVVRYLVVYYVMLWNEIQYSILRIFV